MEYTKTNLDELNEQIGLIKKGIKENKQISENRT